MKVVSKKMTNNDLTILQNYCKDFVIGIRLHLTRLAVILEPVNVQFCAFYLFDAILLKIKGEFDYDDFSS